MMRFAVIGAGMSGILAAIKLREAGYDVVVYEKADRLGGTWRENTYPGLSCDVPSHFYSYSFALNPGVEPSLLAGRGDPGLLRGRRAALRGRRAHPLRHARSRAAPSSAGAGGSRLADGSTDEADFVIAATGVLHHPAYPDIAGARTPSPARAFTARAGTTACALAGKRVGVVGTGSSAIQIVGAIVDEVAELRLFQRTPQWIAPMREPRLHRRGEGGVPARPGGHASRSATRCRAALTDGFANVLVDADVADAARRSTTCASRTSRAACAIRCCASSSGRATAPRASASSSRTASTRRSSARTRRS